MVLKELSTEGSRIRTLLSRFGTLLESIFIFVLLLSGIGVIYISKTTGTIGAGIALLSSSLVVQIIAFILLGLYFYLRFLRRRISTD